MQWRQQWNTSLMDTITIITGSQVNMNWIMKQVNHQQRRRRINTWLYVNNTGRNNDTRNYTVQWWRCTKYLSEKNAWHVLASIQKQSNDSIHNIVSMLAQNVKHTERNIITQVPHKIAHILFVTQTFDSNSGPRLPSASTIFFQKYKSISQYSKSRSMAPCFNIF